MAMAANAMGPQRRVERVPLAQIHVEVFGFDTKIVPRRVFEAVARSPTRRRPRDEPPAKHPACPRPHAKANPKPPPTLIKFVKLLSATFSSTRPRSEDQ